jgi:catalase
VHSYSKDGVMRVQNVSDPVYAPNSKGGPKADPQRYPYMESWAASGELVHAAYTPRKDDNDFVQPGTLVRKVMDDAQRDRLVSNLVGHLKDGVSKPVLERTFEYWRSVDKEIGDRVAKGVQGVSPQPASARG